MAQTIKKQKKVLLVNSPSEFKHPVLPLGLATIAAYIREQGINVSIIDAWAESLSLEELEQKVSHSGADIIGIYIVSPRYTLGKATIKTCRQALPDSLIVAGGPHPSAMPEATLNDIPELDVCVIGEGELTMAELVRAIENGADLSAVDGLAYRDGNEIKITKTREFIKDLDTLPFPARDLFPMDKYNNPPPPHGRKKPFLTIITSRGCPYTCAYCSKSVFKQNYRTRSPEKVCDELEELINKYQAKEILFVDDDFSMDMQRAEKICDEIIRRRLKFRWTTSTRVDQVNEQLLKKMKQAGCWMMIYGFESGNQHILDVVNKRFTIQQTIDGFEMARKAGMATLANFIIGLPQETKETIQDTINLIKKIRPTFISGGILIVYPGSNLHKMIQAGEYSGRMRTLKEDEGMPGVTFKGDYTVLEDNLTFEELKAIIQKFERDFFLSPRYIFDSLLSIRSFSDLSYYMRGGWALVKSLFR